MLSEPHPTDGKEGAYLNRELPQILVGVDTGTCN